MPAVPICINPRAACMLCALRVLQVHDLAEEASALAHEVDLRAFMDPSPLVVSLTMPLTRVYHLFNLIGVRHLPVVDRMHRLVGMITRKDTLHELVELKLSGSAMQRWSEQKRKGSAPMLSGVPMLSRFSSRGSFSSRDGAADAPATSSASIDGHPHAATPQIATRDIQLGVKVGIEPGETDRNVLHPGLVLQQTLRDGRISERRRSESDLTTGLTRARLHAHGGAESPPPPHHHHLPTHLTSSTPTASFAFQPSLLGGLIRTPNSSSRPPSRPTSEHGFPSRGLPSRPPSEHGSFRSRAESLAESRFSPSDSGQSAGGNSGTSSASASACSHASFSFSASRRARRARKEQSYTHSLDVQVFNQRLAAAPGVPGALSLAAAPPLAVLDRARRLSGEHGTTSRRDPQQSNGPAVAADFHLVPPLVPGSPILSSASSSSGAPPSMLPSTQSFFFWNGSMHGVFDGVEASERDPSSERPSGGTPPPARPPPSRLSRPRRNSTPGLFYTGAVGRGVGSILESPDETLAAAPAAEGRGK